MTMLKIRPFSGLGFALPAHIAGTLTPINPKVVESLTRAEAGLPVDAVSAIEASSVAAAAGGAVPEGPGAGKCNCLVQSAVDYAQQAMGQTMPAAAQADALTQCGIDAQAFEGFLNQLGVDTKSCSAWWKQPKTWLIGGAVVAAGGLLLWSTR